MELFFSNHEILWKESTFPIANIILFLGIIVFSSLAYLFYKVKFRFSCAGSFFSMLITCLVIWNGSGCNSDLTMKLNTFTNKAIIADNLSKSEYNFSVEDLIGLVKNEYTKSEQKKSVTYYELYLVLKNEAKVKLNTTTKLEEYKTLLGNIQKELKLQLYGDINEIPKLKKQKGTSQLKEICETRFEKIHLETSDDSCTLSWENKLQNFLYPIFCVFFLLFLIWIDTIFIDGFTKSHFLWLIGICLFAIPFGYLVLQKWNAKTYIIFSKDKIESFTENQILGKQKKNSIKYSNIKSFVAQIETTVDSFEISSYSSSDLFDSNENSISSIASKFITIPIYSLPVVDKLRLCDVIVKFKNTEF